MFFSKILKHIPNSGLSRFPLSFSECTQWQVNTSTEKNLQSSEKSQHFEENTIFNEHPVPHYIAPSHPSFSRHTCCMVWYRRTLLWSPFSVVQTEQFYERSIVFVGNLIASCFSWKLKLELCIYLCLPRRIFVGLYVSILIHALFVPMLLSLLSVYPYITAF